MTDEAKGSVLEWLQSFIPPLNVIKEREIVRRHEWKLMRALEDISRAMENEEKRQVKRKATIARKVKREKRQAEAREKDQ